MGPRSDLINVARIAMQRDGKPAQRASDLLNALDQLRPYAQSDAENHALRDVHLAARVLVDVDQIALVPQEDMHRLARAWLAFELTWESSIGASSAGPTSSR